MSRKVREKRDQINALRFEYFAIEKQLARAGIEEEQTDDKDRERLLHNDRGMRERDVQVKELHRKALEGAGLMTEAVRVQSEQRDKIVKLDRDQNLIHFQIDHAEGQTT